MQRTKGGECRMYRSQQRGRHSTIDTQDMEGKIRKKYGRLAPFLDEKLRRLMAASEAWALGYGGIALVSRATGLSIPTIRTGLAELEDPDTIIGDRIRRPGAGRKPLVETDPTWLAD